MKSSQAEQLYADSLAKAVLWGTLPVGTHPGWPCRRLGPGSPAVGCICSSLPVPGPPGSRWCCWGPYLRPPCGSSRAGRRSALPSRSPRPEGQPGTYCWWQSGKCRFARPLFLSLPVSGDHYCPMRIHSGSQGSMKIRQNKASCRSCLFLIHFKALLCKKKLCISKKTYYCIILCSQVLYLSRRLIEDRLINIKHTLTPGALLGVSVSSKEKCLFSSPSSTSLAVGVLVEGANWPAIWITWSLLHSGQTCPLPVESPMEEPKKQKRRNQNIQSTPQTWYHRQFTLPNQVSLLQMT